MLVCVQTDSVVCFVCVQAIFCSQQTYELMLACVQPVCWRVFSLCVACVQTVFSSQQTYELMHCVEELLLTRKLAAQTVDDIGDKVTSRPQMTRDDPLTF